MIEPEMAYYTNEMNMDLIEAFVRYVVGKVLEHCRPELDILERNTAMLENVSKPFTRVPYTEAVQILRGEKEMGGRNAITVMEEDLKQLHDLIAAKQKDMDERESLISKGGIKQGVINFNRNAIDKLKVEIKELQEKAVNIPKWIESARNFEFGNDFGGSDETVITRLFDTPVMVYNWPKDIKAFYMKRCEDDPRFVKGVDLLAPEGYGEIVGGAERETNKEILIERIRHEGLPMEAFEWYLDLRRYGSVPHAGFGLGLERLITWICGIQHVREVIPFPRMYGRLLP
jgi:asparaginyl-tRNA synthetase